MCTTQQNQEQSNMQVCHLKYTYSPRKQRWLMDGESERLTLNQLHNLEIIISMLEDEVMSRNYNSEIEAELKEILERLYYVIGANNG